MLISPELFAQKILQYFKLHGRKDLPWQQDPSPYRVWVSEIMLQQTQVKTVIPYYLKFTKRFKSVKQLAEADLDEVLHHWQGLGYYSRARNLHQCARMVISQFDGEFPEEIDLMESLPGIGRSTAGAILSLSMAKPTPILDGNVKRVLARVFLVDGWYGQSAVAKQLWKLTEKYTPSRQTANFNQAMMDLGANHCNRSKPHCSDCPLNDCCLAYIHGKTEEYPHRKPKKQIPTRSTSMLLIFNEHHQLQMVKRPPSGIWGGLWSLPETTCKLDQQNLVDEFRHTFTHFHLLIKVFEYDTKDTINAKVEENTELAWHDINRLKELALPTPVRKFLFKQFQISI